MTFLELGSALREARMALGLSIEDIADRLKLTSRLVRTLEEGDIAGLPHAVYTRGFIRGYASIVKINLEEYQHVIDEVYPLNVPDEYEEKITLVPSTRRRSKNTHLMLLAFLVCGGLIAGAYWKFNQPQEIVVPVSNGIATEQGASQIAENTQNYTEKSATQKTLSQSNDTQSSKTLSVEERVARDLAKGQGLSQDSAPEDKTVQSGVNSNQNISQNPSVAPESTPNEVAETTNTLADKAEDKPDLNVHEKADTASSTAEKSSPATVSGQHTIVVTAQEDCWMRVVPDGGKTSQMVLKKGESMTYHFKKNLEMRFGNAGGVSLTYDGKAMPAPGQRGKAVTVVYPLKD